MRERPVGRSGGIDTIRLTGERNGELEKRRENEENEKKKKGLFGMK